VTSDQYLSISKALDEDTYIRRIVEVVGGGHADGYVQVSCKRYTHLSGSASPTDSSASEASDSPSIQVVSLEYYCDPAGLAGGASAARIRAIVRSDE